MRTIRVGERSTLGALDRDECLVLLRWETVGRLAVAAPDEAPLVVPVNFVLDGDTVLFRTGPGEKYERLHHQPVSFEVDRFDWFRRIGWSVLVQGRAVEVPADVRAGDDLEPWAPGQDSTLIRIVPTLITGRRIELTPPVTDTRGYL